MNVLSKASPAPNVGENAFFSTGSTNLGPGPSWNSFEELRKQGAGALEAIHPQSVATLSTKTGVFRLMRDCDFQSLLGLASEVCRLRNGMKFIAQAVKVAQLHPDKEHFDLLMQSFSLIAQSPELPQKDGHESFRLTPEEEDRERSEGDDAFDLKTGVIPRPRWQT